MYQIGNFVAAVDGPLQNWIAASHDGNYSLAQVCVAGVVAVIIAICALLGRESRGARLDEAAGSAAENRASSRTA